MSVYQVEEYYVHVTFNGVIGATDVADLIKFVDADGYDASNVSNVDVTIDGFESESEAEEFEIKLLGFIGYAND